MHAQASSVAAAFDGLLLSPFLWRLEAANVRYAMPLLVFVLRL